MEEFFSLQNAKSRDWSVVGSSNLFWHTIWTHPALLGCAPRRKVCAPMRHTRLKKRSKMSIFWDKMETDVPGVRKSCGARLHPRNVSSKVWSRKGWYIHLPSTSRTEVTTQNVKAKIAIWVPTIF